MGIRLTARQALSGYVAMAALLVAVHYTDPGTRGWTAVLINALGILAMLAGATVNHPARRAPWLLLAAANLVALSGTGVGGLSVLNYPLIVPLLKYPLIIVVFLIFIRCRAAERDLRKSADALIPAVGIALLAWFLIVRPQSALPPVTWQLWLVSAAHLAGDLLVVVALAGLLAPGTLRGLAAALLTIGTIGRVASDAAYVAYDLIGSASARPTGRALDVGWLVCYFAWGAAALHPSMTELTRPAGPRELNAGTVPASIIVLRVTSLAAPVALFAQAWLERDSVAGWVAVACGVLLYGTILTRLWSVAVSYRRSLVRERTLRMASAALASARSVQDVSDAVGSAAASLMPQVPAEHSALLSVRDGDYLERVNPVVPDDTVQRVPLGVWHRLARQPMPRFVTAAEVLAARRAEGGAPGPVVPAGYEGAMVFPLNLTDRPGGDPFIGMLAFFGDRESLAEASAALEILAGQATLAVERIVLTRQVVRQRGEALFRTLVHDTSDVILVIGDDRRIRFATPSAAGLFGDTAVDGKPLTDLVGPAGREDVARVVDMMLTLSNGNRGETRGVTMNGKRGGTAPPGFLLRVERLDGRPAVLEVRCSDRRRDPTVSGLVLTLRDVTERHALEQELKDQASHDALTGLPNRLLFTQEAGHALDEVRRTGRTAGVLFVDIDDFKMVNDTRGHDIGDALLVGVAERLAGSVRQTDMAARLGGDEFAVLIADAADVTAVEAFAGRIVQAFSEPFTLGGAEVPSSVTVGVATSRDSADVDELLRHADLALYAAKGAGKRRWRRYHEALSSGMLRRREIQEALDEAMKTSAFTLVYQPIVALYSGQIVGFEALIRWAHPRWGMMLPGQFIDVAEQTGQIVPIGAWVLRQALSDLARWRSRLPPPAPPPGQPETEAPHVSVNVSARQFHDPGFIESVRRALRASGLPPGALYLELTESLLFGNNEASRADLAELSEIGVGLGIDDFGTGYSSLSYLLEMPIDVLKVDKSFVTGIVSSWRKYALVEGIVRLARTLQIEVIAEGIETQTERELLAGMGCEFGQGYLLSVPVGADQAEAMLRLGRGLVGQLPRQRRAPRSTRYITE